MPLPTSDPALVPPPLPPLPLPPLPLQTGMYPYYPGWPSMAPPTPRVWTVFTAFGAAFLVSMAMGMALLMAIAIWPHPERAQSPELLRNSVTDLVQQPLVLLVIGSVTQLVLLGTAISGGILSPIPFVKRLRLNRSTLRLPAYPLVLLGALAIGVLFNVLVSAAHLRPQGTLKAIDSALQHLTAGQVALAVLVLGIVPGFAEEWLFRGYMQTRLCRAWGRWPGIWITAILFGVMHMDLLQSPFAMLFGLYIGYVAEKSSSIRPGMLCHMFNNSLQILFAALMVKRTELGEQIAMVAIIVSLLSLPASIAYLRWGVR